MKGEINLSVLVYQYSLDRSINIVSAFLPSSRACFHFLLYLVGYFVCRDFYEILLTVAKSLIRKKDSFG